MLPEAVKIFDSTLRDGAQGEGIQFSLFDKLEIVRALDNLGASYIEAGNPGSNAQELAFFQKAAELNLKHTRLTAFGPTRRRCVSVEQDANCLSLLAANTSCVAIFGKAWDLHVTEVLRVTPEENLAMIGETLRFFKNAEKEVIFDAEHFFDGYKHNPAYAMQVLDTAAQNGADWLVLCDTNGGAFPDEVYDLTRLARKRYDLPVGIHCHNDGGCAAANSLMAVKAGAEMVQGTFTGFGERCGNAALATIIPNLEGKLAVRCLPQGKLAELTETARIICETANVIPESGAPFIGQSAFAHKAGMHIDGVTKTSVSFEHIDPALVGNKRRLLTSEIAGRSAVLPIIRRILPEVSRDDPRVGELMELLKSLSTQGYTFEGCEASFELAARKHLGMSRAFFELLHYHLLNDEADICSAVVKIRVGDAEEITAAEGDGPVNALDKALRRALEGFYPALRKMRLIDYKVRVLESRDATAARVRVLIQSTDGTDIWTTVGVSPNIIQASWKALIDSIEYKLTKDTR